jgi:hypothetical protein
MFVVNEMAVTGSMTLEVSQWQFDEVESKKAATIEAGLWYTYVFSRKGSRNRKSAGGVAYLSSVIRPPRQAIGGDHPVRL